MSRCQCRSLRALHTCAGAFAQLTLTLCGQNASHRIYWVWYCEDTSGAKIVRDVGTGILPEVLLVVWQALLLPRVLYYIGQVCFAEPAAVSTAAIAITDGACVRDESQSMV